MTEATCLTAKSFQRAFIAVKGIFLFLPLCFQVLSASLFFKILGMERHNDTDFYHCCFFMTCLAKSRQEPFHLQNLINAMFNFTAGAQMSKENYYSQHHHKEVGQDTCLCQISTFNQHTTKESYRSIITTKRSSQH